MRYKIMMQCEFEELAGYVVSEKTYNEVIEPMYMACNLSKREFVKLINRKAVEYTANDKLNDEVKEVQEFIKNLEPKKVYLVRAEDGLILVDLKAYWKFTVAGVNGYEFNRNVFANARDAIKAICSAVNC